MGKAWLRTNPFSFYSCDRLGHGDFECDFPESIVSDDGEDFIKQYGKWLQASPKKTFNILGSLRDFSTHKDGHFVASMARMNMESVSYANRVRTTARASTGGLIVLVLLLLVFPKLFAS